MAAEAGAAISFLRGSTMTVTITATANPMPAKPYLRYLRDTMASASDTKPNTQSSASTFIYCGFRRHIPGGSVYHDSVMKIRIQIVTLDIITTNRILRCLQTAV